MPVPAFKKWCKARGNFWGEDYTANGTHNLSVRWNQFDKKPEGVFVAWSGGFGVHTGLKGNDRSPAFHGVLEVDTPRGEVFGTLQFDQNRQTRVKTLWNAIKDRKAGGANHSWIFGAGVYGNRVWGAAYRGVPELSGGFTYTAEGSFWTLIHRTTLRREGQRHDYLSLFPDAEGSVRSPIAQKTVERADIGKMSIEAAPRGVRVNRAGAALTPGTLITRMKSCETDDWQKVSRPDDLVGILSRCGDSVIAEVEDPVADRVARTGILPTWTHASATGLVVQTPVDGLAFGGSVLTFGAAVQKYELVSQLDLPKWRGYKGAFLGVYGKGKGTSEGGFGQIGDTSVELHSPTVNLDGRQARAAVSLGLDKKWQVSADKCLVGVSLSDRPEGSDWLSRLGLRCKLSGAGTFEAAARMSMPHSEGLPSTLRCAVSAHRAATGKWKFGVTTYTGGGYGDLQESVEEMLGVQNTDAHSITAPASASSQ
eukprot:TRINITY_DN32596_c0_g1_i1.p1 TRINITY_DN32596_c0_g1~~TRINITY_DN32596_c0_g1_i1.p1  ORF type:complete len:501 (+),score=132.73 TRINITY_DN32596_c0_g1_i1:61-1503(+)